MKAIVSLLVFLLGAAAGHAAECKSVAGHINGQRTSAVRTVQLKSGRLFLSGRMAGKAMPRRSLPCKALAKGVLCEGVFDGVLISVMTNGRRMVESVTDPSTKQDLAGFAYTCDQVMKP